MPACSTTSWRLPRSLPRSLFAGLVIGHGVASCSLASCFRGLPRTPAHVRFYGASTEAPTFSGAKRLRFRSLSRKESKKTRINPNRLVYDAIVLIPGYEHMYLNLLQTRPDLGSGLSTGIRQHVPLLRSASALAKELARDTPQGVIASMIRRATISNKAAQDFDHVPVPDPDVAILNREGFDVDDARFWIRVLTARDATDAARRILQAEVLDVDAKLQAKPVPTFVALMTLMRDRISAEALREMLIYATYKLHARQSFNHNLGGTNEEPMQVSEAGESGLDYKDTEPEDAQGQTEITYDDLTERIAMDHRSLFLLVQRLLRHARRVWPESIVSIAKLFVRLMDCYIAQPGREDQARTRQRKARMEHLYNLMLGFLARPASINPVEHVEVYQTAQFELLSRMALNKPAPIVLFRKSYRSIISVQLAMRKSRSEKDWARLKAKSWPPVMEPKMGADELKGPEDGQSRALQAIERMKEAGYGSEEWENAAQILSGWDLDRSPTIQRRTLNVQSDLGMFLKRYKNDPQAYIWAARVRTTRTVDEAWACFLEWKDSVSKPSVAVYLQMLEKLHYEHLRVVGKQSVQPEGSDDLYSGDFKEVTAPPQDPREATYVRTRPPTFHSLAMELLEDARMEKGDADIKLLLEQASSLAEGIKYAVLGTDSSRTLAQCLEGTVDIASQQRVQLPWNLLSGFFDLLSRFPFETSTSVSAFAQDNTLLESSEYLEHRPPIEVAIRILQHIKPFWRPAWHIVMGMIVRTTARRTPDGIHLNYRAVKSWAQSMDSMGLGTDFNTFRLVCSVLAQAARTPRTRDNFETHETSAKYPAEHLQKGLRRSASFDPLEESEFIKGWFHLLVSGRVPRRRSRRSFTRRKSVQDVQDSFPTLLHTPSASALHQYVRALGYLQDWSGLLNLIQWMFGYRKDLQSYNSRRHNGLKLLRRSIIALRACLEGHLFEEPQRNECPSEIISAVQTLLRQAGTSPRETSPSTSIASDETRHVFSWPSDQELDDYLQFHRQTLVRF